MVDIFIHTITTLQLLSFCVSLLSQGTFLWLASHNHPFYDLQIFKNAKTGLLPRRAQSDHLAPYWIMSAESPLVAPPALHRYSPAGRALGFSVYRVIVDR